MRQSLKTDQDIVDPHQRRAGRHLDGQGPGRDQRDPRSGGKRVGDENRDRPAGPGVPRNTPRVRVRANRTSTTSRPHPARPRQHLGRDARSPPPWWSCQSLQLFAGHGPIVEHLGAAADDLLALVALARHDDHVTRSSGCQASRIAARRSRTRATRLPLGTPAMISSTIAAGSSDLGCRS